VQSDVAGWQAMGAAALLLQPPQALGFSQTLHSQPPHLPTLPQSHLHSPTQTSSQPHPPTCSLAATGTTTATTQLS
jgi:hypothetical protein